jgi:Brp/Blh family beta-carotene 15,15'-monooxygenase
MTNSINKYFYKINFFFLFATLLSKFYLNFFKLEQTYENIICFAIIATIGVSHGALDNIKGEKLLSRKFNTLWKPIFYLGYLFVSIFVGILWFLEPILCLTIFLLISSMHFGKEDFELYINSNYKLKHIIFFLRGSLIIILPLFFHYEEANVIFNNLLFSTNVILLKTYTVSSLLIANLMIQIFLLIYGLLRNYISKTKVLLIFIETVLLIFAFFLTNTVIGFTLYFCLMHSIKNIILSSLDLNFNIKKGFLKFLKLSAPLTICTLIISLVALYFMINNQSINESLMKIIFIGLASLALPHIMLNSIFEKINEKKN